MQPNLTIDEYCAQEKISRAHLYNLWARGAGPGWIKMGKRRLITAEQAAAHRRKLEAEAAATAAA